MATSGIGMPALRACVDTVFNNHCSVLLRGCVMVCAPTERFANHFDMAKEINAPPKPNTAAKINNPWYCDGCIPNAGSTKFITTPSTNKMAKLVPKNNAIRNIFRYLTMTSTDTLFYKGDNL